MQPRLAPFVHAIQIWPSITAAPDEVATIVRLGTCNPNSAKQFGQRRDSNGTKLWQTGQANARTDSIVAVRAGRPHRFSRYRGECRNVIGQTSHGRRTAGAVPSAARPYRRGAPPQPWLPNGADRSSPRRHPGDWGRGHYPRRQPTAGWPVSSGLVERASRLCSRLSPVPRVRAVGFEPRVLLSVNTIRRAEIPASHEMGEMRPTPIAAQQPGPRARSGKFELGSSRDLPVPALRWRDERG